MNMFRIFLPYAVKALSGGNWILLNRRYKPLGVFSHTTVDYEKSPSIFKFDGRPHNMLESIAVNTNCDSGYIYFLYDDSCVPYSSSKATGDYFKRIEKLMKFKITGY